MPKENKHARGRRGQKKRAREDATDEVDTNKKPKPNDDQLATTGAATDKAENDLAEAFGGHNPFAAASATQDTGDGDDGRPFYGMLADEEQEYFRHADELLELNNFPSDEDRGLFLANVYREADGKELKIASSQSCSRLMERLILLSTVAQKKKLFQAFSENFLHLIQHRFASHCCEMLFIQSAPIVTQELVGEKLPTDETAETEDIDKEATESMENLFLYTLNELEGQMSYLLSDRFASHTMRVLLSVLAGKPLDDSSNRSLLKSKRKENVGITGLEAKADESMRRKRAVPDSFTVAVEKIIADIATEQDTTSIRVLATHPTGNPSLQLLLELEFSRREKPKGDAPASIVKKLLPDDISETESESVTFINGLMYDQIGSRLLESIVKFAPGKLFKQIYRVAIQERIGSLARNEIASYVVIRVLDRLSKQDLEAAVEQIKSEIPNLVSRSRTAVLKTLLERCHVRNASSSVSSLTDAMKDAYDAEPAELLLKMAKINTEDFSKAKEDDSKSAPSKPHPLQLHGSLLAQAMLAIPGKPADLIRSCLTAQNPEALLYLANNTTTSHIIQVGLKTTQTPPTPLESTFLRKLISSLVPHTYDLALSVSGSHVLDAMLQVTATSPVLFFLTDGIVQRLREHEDAVRDARVGRLVWRNWRAELYSRDRDQWVRKIKAEAAARAGGPAAPSVASSLTASTAAGNTAAATTPAHTPADAGRPPRPSTKSAARSAKSHGATNAPVKSAIQLARERFAAQKGAGAGAATTRSKTVAGAR